MKLGDFDGPTYATGAPGDASRVFVTERPGRVRVIRDGTVLAAPFLDLTAITESGYVERGLLSIAFAPDYQASGRVYVAVTTTAAAATSGTIGEIQVREYRRADADHADPASGRVVLAVRHDVHQNHNGGQLQFGPDGKLWLAIGDGGFPADADNPAQDAQTLLGKLLRLDPATGAVEVLAHGLRNPWRFSFDRANGQLVLADVGQSDSEEIDAGLAANYGWPCFEGKTPLSPGPASCASGTAAPVLTKSHGGDGFCSITGGYVVRDPGLPTLAGRYLYGDFCAPALRSVDLADPASDAAIGLSVESLSSFGEDACGRVLVASLSGPVYRLVDSVPSPCGAAAPPPPPGPAADTRACVLSARVTGLRSVRRSRRLTVALRTDEACQATVSARVRGVASFKARRVALVRDERRVVRVRLSARGARALRRALRRHASLRVAVTVRATDTAGNVARLSRTAKVRR